MLTSHLPFRTFREVPQDLLRALRDVDPRAELLYAGDGRWRLGRYLPSPERRRIGGQTAAHIAQDLAITTPGVAGAFEDVGWYRALRYQRDAVQHGFAFIREFTYAGDPDHRMVRFFRVYCHADRNNHRHHEDTRTPEQKARETLQGMTLGADDMRGLRNPVSFTSRATPPSKSAA